MTEALQGGKMHQDDISKFDQLTLKKRDSGSFSDLQVQAQIRVDVSQSPVKITNNGEKGGGIKYKGQALMQQWSEE